MTLLGGCRMSQRKCVCVCVYLCQCVYIYDWLPSSLFIPIKTKPQEICEFCQHLLTVLFFLSFSHSFSISLCTSCSFSQKTAFWESWWLTMRGVNIYFFLNLFFLLSFSQQLWLQLCPSEDICGMKPDCLHLSFITSFISHHHSPVRNSHLSSTALMR